MKAIEINKEEYGEGDLRTAKSYYKLGYICFQDSKRDEVTIFISTALSMIEGIRDSLDRTDEEDEIKIRRLEEM